VPSRRIRPVLAPAAGVKFQAADHGVGFRPAISRSRPVSRQDGRADRSPGEFYQLDLEMSFITRIRLCRGAPVLAGVFEGMRAQEGDEPDQFPRIPSPRRC